MNSNISNSVSLTKVYMSYSILPYYTISTEFSNIFRKD